MQSTKIVEVAMGFISLNSHVSKSAAEYSKDMETQCSRTLPYTFVQVLVKICFCNWKQNLPVQYIKSMFH